jgi:uncharacterized cupin superfamily protein
MLQRLHLPDAYFWSASFEPQPLIANSYLFVTETGNVVVDPVLPDEAGYAQIERLGGVSSVIVMSPDRRNAAQAFASRYGATVLAAPRHREKLFDGAIAIRLENQKREREFAVAMPGLRTALVGDCLFGSPAGALSRGSTADYADPHKAALGLRRILAVNPEVLLVSYGQSLFANAYASLYELLYTLAGADVHRINVRDLDFRDERDEGEVQPSHFYCLDAEVGFAIGARKLGYRVSTLEPGQRFCPLHSHAREEEMFFVLDGEPSVRTLSGTVRCRKGDFIALPVGTTGTHQLLNESHAPVTVLLLARNEDVEACYYPDSDKLLVDTEAPLVDQRRSIMVRGSPGLDYFDGEGGPSPQ